MNVGCSLEANIFDPVLESHIELNVVFSSLKKKSASSINLLRTYHPCTMHNYNVQPQWSTLALSVCSSPLCCSVVTPRSTPPILCQRSLLLGRSAPIWRGAGPFKTPGEHETEPVRDVSWSPHLSVSGMVKLLSWGVTLGVLCVPFRHVF